MGTAALFKIFEDAAVELVDVFEAGPLHKRSGLFTADATGAKHHEGALFHFLRETGDRVGKLTEVVNVGRDRATKGAHADFVVVARVEQRDRAALVEPLLERVCGQFGRGAASRIDPLDPEGDDFLFDLHQHPIEGLFSAEAFLRREILEAGDGAQFDEEGVDVFARSGYEEVNALGTQENGAAQSAGATDLLQPLTPRGEIVEGGELVGRDIDTGGHGRRRSNRRRDKSGGKTQGIVGATPERERNCFSSVRSVAEVLATKPRAWAKWIPGWSAMRVKSRRALSR